MKNFILALSILLNLHPVFGTDFPYDVNADAKAELSRALAMGRQTNKKVLAVFGANWCAECRTLDEKIYDNKGTLGDEKYIIVKVDVGNFDKNIDLAGMYGNPIKKGIPAAIVITPENKTVYKGPLAHLIYPQRRFMKFAFYIAAAIAALVAAGWLGSLALRAVRRHYGHFD